MSKSMKRVKAALTDAGLDVNVLEMDETTRTAQDAAKACKCGVAQIVKSLIFQGQETGELKLLLVSGAHQVDVPKMKDVVGEGLGRADAKLVREITGFAIGGVSPIGHLTPLPTFMDKHLLAFENVWAAAGKPNAVFEIEPKILLDLTKAELFEIT